MPTHENRSPSLLFHPRTDVFLVGTETHSPGRGGCGSRAKSLLPKPGGTLATRELAFLKPMLWGSTLKGSDLEGQSWGSGAFFYIQSSWR